MTPVEQFIFVLKQNGFEEVPETYSFRLFERGTNLAGLPVTARVTINEVDDDRVYFNAGYKGQTKYSFTYEDIPETNVDCQAVIDELIMTRYTVGTYEGKQQQRTTLICLATEQTINSNEAEADRLARLLIKVCTLEFLLLLQRKLDWYLETKEIV